MKAGDPLKLQLLVGESMDIKFEVFNIVGQIVYKTEAIHFEASDDTQEYMLNLPAHYSSGMYLIRPMAVLDPNPLPGFVVGSGGESYKLLYMK